MSRNEIGGSPKFDSGEVNAYLARVFPQIGIGSAYTVEETRFGYARIRMYYRDQLLRPGGTISGPAMFGLADLSVYAAILASIGWVELAVTSNLNINFLRRPRQRDMIGEATLLKIGRRLVVAEVPLFSEGDADRVAHATVTYALPENTVL